MILFYAICGALVLLSGLFLLPSRHARADRDADVEASNREWYRLRQAEIAAEGAEALEDDVRLRMLEDDQQAAPAAPAAAGRFPGWVLLPVVAIMAGGLYYALGGARDVAIARDLQAIDGETTPAQMRRLITEIEARAEQRPNNLHYMALLGRYYMGQGDYASALETYDALLEEVPEDAQALAFAAQAEYLAAGRTLSDAARLRAEQALAADPHERTALGLLGMAAYEQGQYRAAIGYWERLLATEPPGSESAQMIAGIVARARQAIAQSTVVAPAEPVAAAALAPGVTVSVALPAGAEANPGDTLFVLARSATSGSRMPIAVQRHAVAQLPLQLRLDDSSSMAGQKISEVGEVVVVAQVSPDGRPGPANATWMAESAPVLPSTEGGAVELLLVRKSP